MSLRRTIFQGKEDFYEIGFKAGNSRAFRGNRTRHTISRMLALPVVALAPPVRGP